MLGTSFKVFRFFLKLSPVAFLLLLLVLPVYDRVVPASFASQGLSAYESQVRVCVGAESNLLIQGGVSGTKQRTYLLFPRVLRDPGLVSVTLDVSSGQITTDESAGGLWFLLVVIAFCVWATWRFWIRPIKTLGWKKFREAV
jgi:hypothetical protein